MSEGNSIGKYILLDTYFNEFMEGYILKSEGKVVTPIILEQSNLFELLVFAIILAFGINLISDSLPFFLHITIRYKLAIGIIFILMPILYLFFKMVRKRQQSREVEAFFIISRKDNKFLEVPRYDFSERISRHLMSAFAENDALKIIWRKESLSSFFGDIRNPEKEENHSNYLKCKKMLVELVEYYLLEKLSTHLTDYFNQEDFSESNLVTFNRKDIPQVLLSNRFLELFSKPMEERSQFVEATLNDKNSDKIIMSGGFGRPFFKKFVLTLPSGSKISRPENDVIEICTEKMDLKINVVFEGFSTVLPDEFEKLYLGLTPQELLENYSEFKIIIKITVLFKLGALLTIKGWKYYYWVDSFLDSIEKAISQDYFFTKINWESALTYSMINYSENKIKNRKKNRRN